MRLFLTSKVHIRAQILGSNCQHLLTYKFMSPGIWDSLTKVHEFDELRFVDITHYFQPVLLNHYIKWLQNEEECPIVIAT